MSVKLSGWYRMWGVLTWMMIVSTLSTSGAETSSPPSTNRVQVVEVEGIVEFAPAGCPDCWHACQPDEVLYPGYRLRTGAGGRATVRLPDLTLVPMGEKSHFEVYPEKDDDHLLFRVLEGVLYFFRRGEPGEFRVDAPSVSAVTKGTEFSLQVESDGTTVLRLYEGLVTMQNAQGQIEMQSGDAVRVEPGQAPQAIPYLDVAHALQWRLYYPGLLDVSELPLHEAARARWGPSLEAYRQGDLPAAFRLSPQLQALESDAERVFKAALQLVSGQVTDAEGLLDTVGRGSEPEEAHLRARALAEALRVLIEVVRGDGNSTVEMAEADLATTWMAESYRRQVRGELREAREAARRACERSPEFGFAWVRLAELEFGFGQTARARSALARALTISPRHAQAWALHGFLSAARDRLGEAVAHFEHAMELQPALGNAWLGRGLCRIRQGHLAEGVLDLQTAVALEPQRSIFRSYLGKAWQQSRRETRADIEWRRAIALDDADPTPWLYRALGHQEQHRLNRAVYDLQRSQALNDQRLLYRSKLLIDQDRAVRGANLASVYRDAGLEELSRREALKALNADYANYSAHWMLANSYDALRDPRQVYLRYETPWLSEYLMANLMSPPAAGTLSPLLSQQDYGRLFEQDRLGISTLTEYRSNGDWLQSASQYGNYRSSAYAVDGTYRSQNGYRPGEDLEDLSLTVRLKQRLGPNDQIYWQGIYYDAEFGDLNRYYDPRDAHEDLRISENQDPIMLLGYHHAWGPGSHTLFLGGRLQDTWRVDHPEQGVLAIQRDSQGRIIRLGLPSTNNVTAWDYENAWEAYTAEAQQIWQGPSQALIVGARVQSGQYDTESALEPATWRLESLVGNTPFQFSLINRSRQDEESYLFRGSGYAYHLWRPWDSLEWTSGLAYDVVRYPENHRYAPISGEEDRQDQVSPKAGLIWRPWRDGTVRASYTRSLGGVSFEQSFRLEPTQVGGFNQAFRSLIPESEAGVLAVPRWETWGAAWDQQMGSNTWLSVEGQVLRARGQQSVGFLNFALQAPATFEQLQQDLDFEEDTLLVTLNRLLGDHAAVGMRYRWSRAEVSREFPAVTVSPGQRLGDDFESILHQTGFYGLVFDDNGLFGQADVVWSQQSNRGYRPDRPGDDFWQFHLHAGYRFPRRRAEVRVSLLNLLDQNYRLNPLNLTAELPRERTLAVSARLVF